ncbi:MAG: autotransporter outer membrane beta-barrel domain-containing protein [Schwartzia sp.]|nr:autotransporter outer membrane beta-barrel domain-containing protein [Schwartzia sp. (in: firmicutes)]
MSKKKNFKQKMAVAAAVVNVLNVGAAVALPYVTMTPNVLTGGATVRQLTDGVAGSMYGTAHAQDEVITDEVYEVGNGAQTSHVTVKGVATSGVLHDLNGGFSHDTIISKGGTLIVDSGGGVSKVTDSGGVLELHSGAKFTNEDKDSLGAITNPQPYAQYALNGGTLRLLDGAAVGKTEEEIMTVNNGTLEIGSGGTAIGTVVQAGGTQHVLPNGNATETDLEGGTVSVEDDATAQIASATGGTLELRDTGLAEAVFGGLGAGVFNLDTLTATGDVVRLGLGDINNKPTGFKTLNIANLNGAAQFYVNTDLANNQSDKINIAASTAGQNKILINFDPTLATGQAVTDKKALVASVGDSNATFEGAETTIGGYKWTPTLASETAGGGTNWFITGVLTPKTSEQMYASVDTATWQAIAWRDSNFVIGSRLATLHHDPDSAHQNDFWVDFTRGRLRTNSFGMGVNRTYSRVSVGYDRFFGGGWTAGLAYGYESGSEGYNCGSGDSTGNVLTAYATWQGGRGDYLDLTLKGGQLDTDFVVQGENQPLPSKADTKTHGAGLSAVYGHRFENATAFYVEPHAGFYWSHLNGYNYRLSDDSDVNVDACNSFVGNLGVNIGQRLGKGEVYARADFMHDFSGNVRVAMSKAGTTNLMENPLHDSWLNVAIGYRQNYERVGWYAEAGCQSIGSRESAGDWIWRAGVELKF